LVPTPLDEPDEVTPANVVTEAVDMTMWRIILLSVSPTNTKVPVGEMWRPFGNKNLELVPIPLVEP
jgi:carbon starvation protein CstA